MNVTYIIGAGASAQAIPPVGEEFNRRFSFFCKILLYRSRKIYPTTQQHQGLIQNAIQEIPLHYSVDTYARKIFFNRNSSYSAFKMLLSSYFLFEQLKTHVSYFELDGELQSTFTSLYQNPQKTVDPRYDVVYAALLDEVKHTLPPSLYFVTWNYDIQFELSLTYFLNNTLSESFKKLSVSTNGWWI